MHQPAEKNTLGRVDRREEGVGQPGEGVGGILSLGAPSQPPPHMKPPDQLREAAAVRAESTPLRAVPAEVPGERGTREAREARVRR